MQPKESVEMYVATLQKLARQSKEITADILKHAIISGLRPEIRHFVLQSNHGSIDDLIKVAKIAEESYTDTNLQGLTAVVMREDKKVYNV